MLKTKRRSEPRVKPRARLTAAKAQSNPKAQSTFTKKKVQIKSKETYDATMKEIDVMIKKGESNLSQKELARLRSLAEAAELYEDKHDPLPLPQKLPEIIRMRMYQMHINQSFAAKLLGVSDTKFSMILSGKQNPDINFLKALHRNLKVDANLILQAL